MKKLIIIPLLFFSLICMATNYHFATAGDDVTGNGSIATPYKTITKLNALWAAGTLAPGDSVCFKAGDTFTGTITVSEAGTAGNPIIIGKYWSGDNPIITGMSDISGSWTETGVGTNIWYKAVTTSEDIRFLSIDGTFYSLGKYPDSGTEEITALDGTNRLYFEDNINLTQVDDYWNGAEVVIRTSRYSVEERTVIDFDQSDRRVTLSSALVSWRASAVGWGYILQNHIGCLDDNGDWMWDGTNIYLYYNSDPSALTIKVSLYGSGIYSNPYDYIEAVNLTLIGYNGSLGGIRYQNTSYCKVTSCSISYAINGFYSYNSDHLTIGSNTFTLCNRAIAISGFYPGAVGQNIIESNTITNIGLDIGLASGLIAGIAVYDMGYQDTIRYNDLNNIASHGLYAANDYIVIEKNRIKSYAQVVDDVGGIYTDNKNYVKTSYNFVECGSSAGALESVTGSVYQSIGIYYDQNNTYAYSEYNLSVGNLRNFLSNSPQNGTWTYNWSCKATPGAGTSQYDDPAEFLFNTTSNATTGNTITYNKFITNYNDFFDGVDNFYLYNIETTTNVFDYNYLLQPTGNKASAIGKLVYQYIPPSSFNYTLTTWKAAQGGDNETGDVFLWTSEYANTSKTQFVTYDYNFSDAPAAYTYEAGWTYYQIDGTSGAGITLDPYEGMVLYRINESDQILPSVVVTLPVNVGTTSAISGGNVLNDGGGTVSARGVCWGASENPTTSDSKTTDGTGTGAFTSTITGLLSNTTYHVRAYATNENGTSYGGDIEFTTKKYAIGFINGKPAFINGKRAVIY